MKIIINKKGFLIVEVLIAASSSCKSVLLEDDTKIQELENRIQALEAK